MKDIKRQKKENSKFLIIVIFGKKGVYKKVLKEGKQ